jgi:hypothetical protein
MKLIAKKINAKSAFHVYESETGCAVIVRTGRAPLTWTLDQPNTSLGRPLTAVEFANFNRIPLVNA